MTRMMMNLLVVAFALGSFALGCEDDPPGADETSGDEDTVAEEAGEAVDEAADDTEEAVDEAVDD